MTQQIEIPEIFQGYMVDLIHAWNTYDFEERARLREQGRAAYSKGDGRINWELHRKYYRTDNQIIEDNTRTVRHLIINLIKRVEKKVGTITDYSMLTVRSGNFTEGSGAINGIIKGEKRTVTVRSIHAGGYNIQRLHVRVLVK